MAKPYTRTGTFQAPPIPRPDEKPDAYNRRIHDWAKSHAHQTLQEFAAIETALKSNVIVTNIISGGSSGGGSGGGSTAFPTVRTSDLLTIVPDVSLLDVDQDDGFILSASGAGHALVRFRLPAINDYRSGSDPVSALDTNIAFSKPFSDDNIRVKATSCVAGGVQVGVQITSYDATGFVARPLEDATLEWIAQSLYTPFEVIAQVTAGGLEIPFPYDLGSTNYAIDIIACINSDGDAIGVTVSNKQTDRFTGTSLENAVLYARIIPFQ